MQNSTFVIDNYVGTRPGEPYRLLPFGPIQRATGGPKRELTPELAGRFKLPHFSPPIKLGSHEDTTPAGGHMKGLFVRNEGNPATDGLWVTPEMTDAGASASARGDYKYHSPEIIWEDGGIEDATTGQFIMGPLIVGDALLHAPALGEATAMYTAQTFQGVNMTIETVNVPKTFWDSIMALFPGGQPPAAPATPPPAAEPTEALKAKVLASVNYDAIKAERDDLAAKWQAQEAKNTQTALVSKIVADLQKPDRFGATYAELPVATTAAEMLAAMTDDQRTWVMRNFAAMTAQIDASTIGKELGSQAAADANTDSAGQLDAAIKAKMTTAKVDYAAAMALVRTEQPDLFKAYKK
jgi:hypothetical protein